MTPHPAVAQREALRLAYAALTAPETSIGGWYAHSVTGVLPVIREALAAAAGSVPEDGGEALRRAIRHAAWLNRDAHGGIPWSEKDSWRKGYQYGIEIALAAAVGGWSQDEQERPHA